MRSMRALATIALLVFLFAACKPKEAALDVIHQTIDEARRKPRVVIDIRSEAETASPAELQLQQGVENRIEREHIGRVVGGGSGPGSMRIIVEVDETVVSIAKLRAILRSAGVMDRSSVKIAER